MLLRVLDENRVKILMEAQDIDYYDLPFEKLNYDDPISRAFIYELIQKAYDQTGVDFGHSTVLIEVIPGVAGNYYIVLTKQAHEGDEIHFDKTDRFEEAVYLYECKQGSELFAFFFHLKEMPPEKSFVYRMGSEYYVLLHYLPQRTQSKVFLRYLCSLEEFGTRCRYDYSNEGILFERGNLLVGPDAFGYFGCIEP